MNVTQMLNQCFRKRIFRSITKAQAKANEWNIKAPPEGSKIFHGYYCALCGNFHVGRTDPPITKGQNEKRT